MPCLNELNLMISHNALNPVEFSWRESVVVFQADWRQPELGSLAFASYVNMDWLAMITGKEKEPIRTTLENRRAHPRIVPAF